MTEAEVVAAIRQHGIGSLAEVAAVVLETDVSFSVIRDLGPSPTSLCDVTGAEQFSSEKGSRAGGG